MSYRSGHHSEYAQHHPHDHGRAFTRRAAANSPSASTARDAPDGYTFTHAGRQVRFGPVVFWIVVVSVTILGMWSAATATCVPFPDAVPTRFTACQRGMPYANAD